MQLQILRRFLSRTWNEAAENVKPMRSHQSSSVLGTWARWVEMKTGELNGAGAHCKVEIPLRSHGQVRKAEEIKADSQDTNFN